MRAYVFVGVRAMRVGSFCVCEIEAVLSLLLFDLFYHFVACAVGDNSLKRGQLFNKLSRQDIILAAAYSEECARAIRSHRKVPAPPDKLLYGTGADARRLYSSMRIASAAAPHTQEAAAFNRLKVMAMQHTFGHATWW